MQVEITGKTDSEDYAYSRVEFSCNNDSDVSFIDSVSLAQACFLVEHAQLQPGPFLDAMRYINATHFSAIEVGKVFEWADEDE